MSLQAALRFVRAVREDEALADRVRALGPAAPLARLAALAADAGFDVTEDELRAAHAHDHALRRVRYADQSGE
jgi:predicted ribosomally synthesized peptide with nif11-like leader